LFTLGAQIPGAICGGVFNHKWQQCSKQLPRRDRKGVGKEGSGKGGKERRNTRPSITAYAHGTLAKYSYLPASINRFRSRYNKYGKLLGHFYFRGPRSFLQWPLPSSKMCFFLGGAQPSPQAPPC